MSRRSTRTRGTRSKYFEAKDDDVGDKSEDKDSDYNPSDEDDLGAKTRKRKSASAAKMAGVKSKRSRPSSSKGSKKAAKVEPDLPDIPDHNNNHLDVDMEVDDSDDDDGDFVEVPDAEVFDVDTYQPELPSNLKITVEKPKKEKQQGDWVERYIRQEINRIRKKIQLDAHKSHLLLLIGRIKILNALANDPIIQALVMSVLPGKFKPTKESVVKFIPKLFSWMSEEFNIDMDRAQIDSNLYLGIISSFENKSITSPIIFAIIFVAICRTLRLYTRLCYFLNPVSVKASDLLTKKSKKKSKGSSSSASSSVGALEENGEAQNRDSSEDWKFNYHWIEVFDQSKKKWHSFNLANDCIQTDAYAIASEPDNDITYVVAIDNEDFVSEVTARYAADWVSYAIKKRRVEDGWWEDTLKLFTRPDFSVYEDADKKEFDEIMSKVELPKKMSEFKNHPLFVLQRDILKFQAIYPPDAPTLGFFRDQPVFSRDCVHLLKSRETWLRSARTVKVGEEPYKVVDSRFKNDDKRGRKATVDLFGEWQTEQYVPPVAENGIVPRNAYGNVELFKECMLPVGTVHLEQPGLARIAAKLNIDYAPAVIGFDCVKNHRITRPILGGIVVCSQFKGILLDAWKEKQAIIRQKEITDREKRIYDNWKRLIRGLIIRQNLKIKYG